MMFDTGAEDVVAGSFLRRSPARRPLAKMLFPAARSMRVGLPLHLAATPVKRTVEKR